MVIPEVEAAEAMEVAVAKDYSMVVVVVMVVAAAAREVASTS
jgi:hypothetical protein